MRQFKNHKIILKTIFSYQEHRCARRRSDGCRYLRGFRQQGLQRHNEGRLHEWPCKGSGANLQGLQPPEQKEENFNVSLLIYVCKMRMYFTTFCINYYFYGCLV